MATILNNSEGVVHLWDRPSDIRLNLLPCKNELTKEQETIFEKLIESNSALRHVVPMNEYPVEASKVKKPIVSDEVKTEESKEAKKVAKKEATE